MSDSTAGLKNNTPENCATIMMWLRMGLPVYWLHIETNITAPVDDIEVEIKHFLSGTNRDLAYFIGPPCPKPSSP